MNGKGLLIHFVVIFCLFIFSPFSLLAQPKPEIKVEQATAELEFAYEARSLANMMALVDKDYEDWLGFKSSLENYFLGVKELKLHIAVDSYLSEKDKITVRLHWFKTAINNAGSFSKTEGTAQFVFKSEPEGLKLLYLRGNNPFF